MLERFLARNRDLKPEWKYYGAKLGWNLKLFRGKRNLCFISPHEDHWTIAFALGARAVDSALNSDLPDSVKQEIRDARKYAEGRGVRITVREPQDLVAAETLLEIKNAG